MSERTFRNGNADSLSTTMKCLSLSATDATYSMKPGDTAISAVSSGDDGVAIITLPALAEAYQAFYYIEAPTGATGGDISLYEKETGAELSTYGDLDADDDHVILYPGKSAWRVVLDGVA